MILTTSAHGVTTPLSNMERRSTSASLLVQSKGSILVRNTLSMQLPREEFIPSRLSILESCSTKTSLLSKDLETLMMKVATLHQDHQCNLHPNVVPGEDNIRRDAACFTDDLMFPCLDNRQEQAQDEASSAGSRNLHVIPSEILPLPLWDMNMMYSDITPDAIASPVVSSLTEKKI